MLFRVDMSRTRPQLAPKTDKEIVIDILFVTKAVAVACRCFGDVEHVSRAVYISVNLG